jgi:acyl-homoserine-lactone acylase
MSLSAWPSRIPKTISPPSSRWRWRSAANLAATEGPKAAVTDYLVRLFRVWETVNAKYESDLPPDLRQVLEAYADGVNYYAALHPGQVMRGLLPFTGKDVVAGFVFKLPFFYGLDTCC